MNTSKKKEARSNNVCENDPVGSRKAQEVAIESDIQYTFSHESVKNDPSGVAGVMRQKHKKSQLSRDSEFQGLLFIFNPSLEVD